MYVIGLKCPVKGIQEQFICMWLHKEFGWKRTLNEWLEDIQTPLGDVDDLLHDKVLQGEIVL